MNSEHSQDHEQQEGQVSVPVEEVQAEPRASAGRQQTSSRLKDYWKDPGFSRFFEMIVAISTAVTAVIAFYQWEAIQDANRLTDRAIKSTEVANRAAMQANKIAIDTLEESRRQRIQSAVDAEASRKQGAADAAASLRMAQRTLDESRKQARPHLRLAWQTGLGDDGRVECLKVFNDGPALTSFAIYQRSLLAITRATDAYEVRHLPIYYLFDRQFTGEGQGLLATLCSSASSRSFGPQGNSRDYLDRLTEEIADFVGPGGGITVSIVLEIYYRNILGVEEHAGYVTGLPETHEYYGAFFARIPGSAVSNLHANVVTGIGINYLNTEQIRQMWPHLKDLSTSLYGNSK